MIAFGGRSPVLVEYDIDFPASDSYRLSVRYTAAEERPVALLLDGKMAASVCCSATGSWNTSGAQWVEGANLYIPAGKHTIRLQRAGAFPHVVSLKFASAEIPDGFVLNRPHARKLSDPPPPPLFQPHVPEVKVVALRLAIRELLGRFGSRYSRGEAFLRQLDDWERQLQRPETAGQAKAGLIALRDAALVRANPLLDFGRLLLVKRSNTGPDLGLPRNWESNSSLPKHGYSDSLCVLSLGGETNGLSTFFRPERDVFVGDLDLNWAADKLLFSSVGTNERWQVFELRLPPALRRGGRESAHSILAGKRGRPVSAAMARPLTGEQPDVDSYDACYLPDGRIIFTSTACFVGVPCVYGIVARRESLPDGRRRPQHPPALL